MYQNYYSIEWIRDWLTDFRERFHTSNSKHFYRSTGIVFVRVVVQIADEITPFSGAWFDAWHLTDHIDSVRGRNDLVTQVPIIVVAADADHFEQKFAWPLLSLIVLYFPLYL